VARALGKKRVVLLKNHGSVVAGSSVAEVCVTAQRLERMAEMMLRAAAIGKLPVMSTEERAAVMAARKAAEGALREDTQGERWQMLQDYYLREEES
jgi:ribulose-5-phosphate 4-epimerase/fuculose-1-phosphate aldolase